MEVSSHSREKAGVHTSRGKYHSTVEGRKMLKLVEGGIILN